MNNVIRTLMVFALTLAGVMPLSTWAADDLIGGYYLKYSVSDSAVTVVSAATPYDSNPQAKEAFLNWFKRGFETVLKGKPPLMIEWSVTPVAEAGRKGYDFGMDEAEKYLKKENGSKQSPQVIHIQVL